MRTLNPRENVRRAIQAALTELAQPCVQLLTAALSKPLTDEAVHEIRTHIKRMRALLRLVRADIGHAGYAQARRKLKQTSHSLANVRDAKVMLTTCQQLLRRRTAAYRAAYSIPLRRRLRAARKTYCENASLNGAEADDCPKLRGGLARIPRRLESVVARAAPRIYRRKGRV
ncbi:MAG: CHAD domain-containing protein [Proteobacteria bacterium]|nr:CHAD domain-containing protein [Pseudomonadota bacterium]